MEVDPTTPAEAKSTNSFSTLLLNIGINMLIEVLFDSIPRELL